MIRLSLIGLAALACAAVSPAFAKVPAADADHLGKNLTCVGAEKAGNKDGTIPEFSGKWLGTPPGIKYTPHVGEHPINPYPSDKPLFSITAENASKYADKLSDGQKAMFAKYPKTFRMDVYQSRRDFRYPDFVCEAAKKNALNAEVDEGGLGVKNGVNGSVLFPIPKTALEVFWNHTLPYRAFTDDTLRDYGNVLSNGNIAWGRARNLSYAPLNDPKEAGKPLLRWQAYNRSYTLLPERDKGTVTVTQEPADFGKDKRLAWTYDPGTRRVRQLPEFGFDQPLAFTGGKMTIDSDRIFNGTPERYDWKLVGKREIYIPYNAYRLHAKTVKYADLIKPGHENPDYIRYELHRVWVLEATLKQGFRHIYGKRTLFLDEDTWHTVMGDYYDTRGQLWQWGFIGYYYAFDEQAWNAGSSFYHDLNSGGYIAYNLFQEQPKGPILNKGDMKPEMFTPEAARQAGN